MAKIKVTQIRSATDKGRQQQGTIRALGLKRLGHSVTHEDKPEIRGMIAAVEHLVTVEETGGSRGASSVRSRTRTPRPKQGETAEGGQPAAKEKENL